MGDYSALALKTPNKKKGLIGRAQGLVQNATGTDSFAQGIVDQLQSQLIEQHCSPSDYNSQSKIPDKQKLKPTRNKHSSTMPHNFQFQISAMSQKSSDEQLLDAPDVTGANNSKND